MELANRHIFITGANRGIGFAIAKMAAQEKAHVHLVVRQDDPHLVEAIQAAGATSVKLWTADLASREGVERLANSLKNETVDILVNNAGQLTGGLLEEQSLDEIYSMFQVNVNALVHLSRAVIPGMVARGRGKIVNNSSVSAVMHFPCASTYAASKAAVLAFTDCLQVELKGTGVDTLCLITPGIKTRMFDEIEVKYAKNFEIPTDSISPDEYAAQIKEAILKDHERLEPRGATAFGLAVARYIPSLFRMEVNRRFHR